MGWMSNYMPQNNDVITYDHASAQVYLYSSEDVSSVHRD